MNEKENVHGITKIEKVPSNNIGKVMMGVSVLTIILCLIAYVMVVSDLSPSQAVIPKTKHEFITITTTNWVKVTTNPDKEWCDFGITDPNLKYLLVTNGAFDRPLIRPDSSSPHELSGKIKTHHFSLMEGQEVDRGEIYLKKIPK